MKRRVTPWCALACLVGMIEAGCSNVTTLTQRAESGGSPSAQDIARATTVPLCPVANADRRFDGQLVRVSGTYAEAHHTQVLTADDCGRMLFLSFDEVDWTTPAHMKWRGPLTSAWGQRMAVVGRVGMERGDSDGARAAKLTVYAIESGEP